MGLPFIYAVYGQIGVYYAAIFIIPYHILMWTYGIAMFMKIKDYRSSAKAILTNPILAGVFIGLILFVTQIPVPLVLSKSFTLLGGITSPLAMMLIGDRMATTKFTSVINDKDVYYGSFLRLLIAPVISWIILRLFHMDPMIINICVAVEALPVAVTVAVLPARYNGDATLGSKCAVVSHALSLITIPVMMILLMVK
jgi:predicted permease